MRLSLLVLALLSVTPLVALPAEATHMGPCTHEYFDVAFYDVENYKNGGLARLPADMQWVIAYCSSREWAA